MANFANVDRFGDPKSPGWEDQNLVTIQSKNGQSWRVHKNAAGAFEGLLNDLIDNGYTPTSSGGYNYRNIRGGSQLSQHAFGTAIDIGADRNPMLSPGSAVATDMPANTAELARKHGLEWGGNWKRPDAMHFEWMGPQDGSGQSMTQLFQAPGGRPDLAKSLPAAAQAGGVQSPMVAGSGLPMMAQAGAPSPVGMGPIQTDPGGAQNIALASLFMQQQQSRQQRQRDEQSAAEARRRALFSGPSPFG